MKNQESLITNSVYLMPHEQATVDFLLRHGYMVELIPRSKVAGVHTADILLDGVPFEIKSPTGRKRWTITRNLKRARKQSKYIVLDLRRICRDEVLCIREAKSYLMNSRVIERVMIITKERKILDFHKEKM